MIEFQTINNSSDPLFKDIYELYVDTFPSSERRKLDGFKSILDHEKNFCVQVIFYKNCFSGFITHWEFEQFYYIEHFAVNKLLRGQNIGSLTLKTFLSKTEKPIVLEVEIPETTDAIRRIKFYEKLNFKIVSKPYLQPFYDGSGDVLPMLIMSNDDSFAESHFNLINYTLHKEVYKFTTQE